MSLANSYQDLDDSSIINMPHDKLVEAVLRITNMGFHQFGEADSYRGAFLLPDEIADAFRNRI